MPGTTFSEHKGLTAKDVVLTEDLKLACGRLPRCLASSVE